MRFIRLKQLIIFRLILFSTRMSSLILRRISHLVWRSTRKGSTVLYMVAITCTWIQKPIMLGPRLTVCEYVVSWLWTKSKCICRKRLFITKKCQSINNIPFLSNRYVGHRPDIGPLSNSGYMADYINPFVSQIRKWMDSDTLISHSQQPGHLAALGPERLQFKTTIEPKY